MNFFRIVEPKLFNPLTGSNKEINFDILSLINDNMKNLDSFEKREIIEWIKEYFDNRPTLIKLDDENQDETISDNREVANRKLNYLSSCGWLSTETVGFQQYYTMNPAAITMINAMNEAIRNETKPIEYTGYVGVIYHTLRIFDLSKSTATLEILEKTANEFNNSLRSVNVIIKKYITKMLKSNENSAKKILTTLLVEYQENVVSKVFTNLRTGDNPSKYRKDIISKIDELLDNNMNQMIENYLVTKKTDDRHEAKTFIENSLNSVKDVFENINDKIDVLNSRNEKYVQVAHSRAQFLLNNDKDVEGRIYEILKKFNNIDDENMSFSFGIKELGKTNMSSLYKRTKQRKLVLTEVNMNKPKIDPEYVKQKLNAIKRNLKFSKSSVKNWIFEKMGNRKSIEAKDISMTNFDDVILLFLVVLYSRSKLGYYIEVKNDEGIEFQKSKFKNFIVRRK